MNNSTPARRPVQSPNRRRRRWQNRQFRLFLLIHQIILILLAAGIGYLIGTRASQPDTASTQPPETTGAHAQLQTPVSTQPQGPADTTAPQIMGVNKLSVFLGGTVAYRSGILVTDDLDPAPKLTVDTFQVNLAAPGTYPVFYTATDSAGNSTTLETTLTVAEAPDTYVDEALINETADKLLDKILTDDMTKQEQVCAIYDWIEGHCYYIAQFDKTDYKQAAYLMLTENRGDCYGFYAISRLLLERLGLPNLTVTRLPNEERSTNHWWNMVSLDGGETWYHFDATPHMTYPTRTCLITDADLEAFNELMPGYYCFDQDSFPRTPVE